MQTQLIPEWGWWIVIYFFLGGIAGGAYFLALAVDWLRAEALQSVARAGYLIAFPLVVVCAISLIADLGRPERFTNMILNMSTLQMGNPGSPLTFKLNSPMSVGSYALVLFGLWSALSFASHFVFKRDWLRRITTSKLFLALGGFFGIFLASYTGVLLAYSHMPAWANTPFLGGLFLASGASTGASSIALLLALHAKAGQTRDGFHSLELFDRWAIAVEAAFLVLLFVGLGAAAAPFFRLPPALFLFGGTVLLGLLAPMLLQLRGSKDSRSMTIVSAMLVLLGGFALRAVVVLAPQGLM